MEYAVIESGGKQYFASIGEVITVDKIDKAVGDKINLEKILLLKQNNSLLIGSPLVEGAKVTGKILKQYQGEKLHVMKFKAKVHYRRRMGFRPQLTDIKIEDISTAKKSSVKSAKGRSPSGGKKS